MSWILLAWALVVTTQDSPIDGAPLVDDRRVTLYAEERLATPPRLVGDFNGWGRYPTAEGPTGGQMERVTGTGWFRAEIDLAPDARVEYGFVYGDEAPIPDPNNPLTTMTFGTRRSVVELFIQGGLYDVRFIGDYYNALDTLRAKGYRVAARTRAIGHSPTSWRHTIPEMLAHFFPAS